MKLINSLEQLDANLRTFKRGLQADADGEFRKLLRRGRKFVVRKIDGQVVFAPSRFVGYVDNTIERHKGNIEERRADGKETNPAITLVLGRDWESSDQFEKLYKSYCKSFGIENYSRHKRGYWLPNIKVSPRDFLRRPSISKERVKSDLESLATVFGDEVLAQVWRRIGQIEFRKVLLKFRKNCAATGIENASILVASHIKPWRVCTKKEKTDPENGLLLAAHFDAAFDAGLISFDEHGKIMVSPELSKSDQSILGLKTKRPPLKIGSRMSKYMSYHRNKIFRGHR